jgi:hypothetical protein
MDISNNSEIKKMMQYTWLTWSLIILVVWVIIYPLKKDFRKIMLPVSLATMLFGFTERLFVPAYWSPPSLFSLAQKTGFDIESFIFSFAIGGIGSILYRILFPVLEIGMNMEEKNQRRHRLHTYILMVPAVIFLLLSIATRLNHIYCGIIALFTGALATLYCRPDLKGKIWIGGLLFMLLYFFYFGSILLFFPGYVKAHWNLPALTGMLIRGVPLEELLFGFTFGMYWSGLYEHIHWDKMVKNKNYKYLYLYDDGT